MTHRDTSWSNILIGTVFPIAIIAITIFLIAQKGLLKVDASSGDNLSGFAWSSNIGWISMNCTDTGSCQTSNYGVNVQPGGDLSGFAWSDNIGWVSFNASDVAGCPSGPCTPHLDQATGDVTGWAKALAGGGPNAGGWNGFISLSGANYGVKVTGCTWSGWAWGDIVVGWVNFGGGFGGTTVGNSANACAVLQGDAISANNCTISAGNSSCNTNVLWNSVGFVAPSVRNGGVTFSNLPSSGVTPVSQSVSYNGGNPTLFELYDGAVQKASANVQATCVSGTKWNGSSCATPVVTFEACDVPSGNNCLSVKNVLTSVPLSLKWTSNADTCKPVSSGFATNNSANGSDSITSNATPNNSDIYSILCQFTGASGAFGTIKTVTVNALFPDPILTVSPRIVEVGNPVTLNWDLRGQTGCSLVGGSLNTNGLNSNGSANVIITGRTTFTLTCGGSSDSVIVEVIPKAYES